MEMPTYEYVCTDCKNGWEEVQKISENPIITCPKCGKPTAKRQISGGNFILKGGGWYADLYSSAKKPESKSAGKTEASSAPAAETKQESKSESTAPAPKAESTAPKSGSST
jgi:putative FmdB family regulatory protein